MLGEEIQSQAVDAQLVVLMPDASSIRIQAPDEIRSRFNAEQSRGLS
jgi:hypothetical protein